jgi:hypothetical protein
MFARWRVDTRRLCRDATLTLDLARPDGAPPTAGAAEYDGMG